MPGATSWFTSFVTSPPNDSFYHRFYASNSRPPRARVNDQLRTRKGGEPLTRIPIYTSVEELENLTQRSGESVLHPA